MAITGLARPIGTTDRAEPVSFARLLWLAPLTVVVALAVNYAIKQVAQALDPSLARMGQLGPPLILLTLEGAVGAIVVFAIMALLLRRPIFWYRVVAAIVLLISILPDLALGMGGTAAMWGMRVMGPFLSLGMPGPSGPPGGGPGGGGPPPGGPPPGGMPAMTVEQVLVLMLLHAATAVVCVVLLTTLTRKPASDGAAGG
ncbi:MAG TPA: hypothetical protein VGM69_17435 [Chloroflexota bacterium]